MKVYLCAREVSLFNAWRIYCGQYDFVTPTKQDIMSIEADAIVSPANSFGFMTGGIDLHYRNYMGKSVQDDLQKKIVHEFNGELLVGQATAVEIFYPPPLVKIKYMIAAPTMRVPEVISHTINVYLAAKAALMEAVKLGMNSIIFPGMGTGTGQMKEVDCAKQVSVAIGDVLVSKDAYKLPTDLYDEQYRMAQHIVPSRWLEIQRGE